MFYLGFITALALSVIVLYAVNFYKQNFASEHIWKILQIMQLGDEEVGVDSTGGNTLTKVIRREAIYEECLLTKKTRIRETSKVLWKP